MTNKNAPNLTYTVVVPTLEEAIKLHETIEKQELELIQFRNLQSAHNMMWESSQKVITQLKNELDEAFKQSDFWKQEFADASKQSLEALTTMASTKNSLDLVMEGFFKYENK